MTGGGGDTVTRSAVALRHVAFEDLGVLEPVLIEQGYRVAYVDVGVDDLTATSIADTDLLIVLGGPIGVGDGDQYPFLSDEVDLLRARLASGLPTLGICLGAQLIAAAFDAPVRPDGGVEIGFAPLSLTADGHRSPLATIGDTPVLHWHGDRFETPVAATNLAATESTPHQAFRIGDQVLALQFHLEVDPAQLERWLIGHAHELASHGIDPRTIRRDADEHGRLLNERARDIFTNWIAALNRDRHDDQAERSSNIA